MQSLLSNTEIARVMDAKAAGATAENGAAVDMRNFEGVMFIAALGALTAGQETSIRAQQAAASDGAFADLGGTRVGDAEDDDDNQLLILDVKRPTERYVRCVVSRGTADAAIDGMIAIRYGPRKKPTTQGSTVSASKAVDGPAEA